MQALMADPQQRRLFISGALAIVCHAFLILGITFEFGDKRRSSPYLEVTLARFNDATSQQQAEALAQSAQQGSGNNSEQSALTNDHPNTYLSDQDQANTPRPPSSFQSAKQNPSLVATRVANDSWQIPLQQARPVEGATDEKNFLENLPAADITSLEAQLDTIRQNYSKMPRIKRLTTLATQRSNDAAYLYHWQQKIERIGNRYYPEQARRLKLFGDVRLMVALLPDGSLHDIRVLQSSGNAVLDHAAVRIVKLSAPFEPFPLEIQQSTDILEIIRTWQFRENRLSSRSN